eukprot:CAMPEP_0116999280 /NCGR_PEP_ID=MMETSP0472-20121206/2044_1 /TAXON_ID=693140 ORGANISM="Tiarina fusus, Strain LIS" /NCGR_SAMPLE_ID=MMETSP0472 /ASSEMBLY_ACC=CAM_ASM_000603 /LENGTH=915 /DNA_ID=CAMNT_0004698659 /DNA_START=98 /DNA_END=2845 /DNA_ORIENTATION=-
MQNQRPKPHAIPIGINFSISPDDPEVPVTPERYVPTYSDFDYETELSSILQTPPNQTTQNQRPQVRRTPGAEIAEQMRQENRSEMDTQFQILQALQNLKLSTEPSCFETSQTPFYPHTREPTSIPFTDQYSLWGQRNINIGVPHHEPNLQPNSRAPMIHPFHTQNPNPMYCGVANPFGVHENSFHNQQPRHFSGNEQNHYGPGSEHNHFSQTVPGNEHNHFNHGSEHNHFSQTVPGNEHNHFSHANEHFSQRASGNEQNDFYSNSYDHGRGNTYRNTSVPVPVRTHPHCPVVITQTQSSKKLDHQTHRRQASSGSPKQTPTVSHKRSASTNNDHSTALPVNKPSKEDKDSSKELVDSPTSNMKFKQFYRGFKQKEKEGYEEASQYAIDHLEILPEKVHWRVFLELADLAKRENRISEARGYYEQVNHLQPTAAQGWLEYAKMEEECGNLTACKSILSAGLSHCTVNESLMVKCLKHYERMGHLQEARDLLGALKDVPVERTWRTIMEGGLLEARQGNIVVARQVFHYLIASVPWYGPIYQEACRFEEKCEEHENAIRFVESGLRENPRYGPLWFSALRLNEKLSENGDVSSMHGTIERAVKSISKELIWKLYFEAAQIEERAGNIQDSREFYVKSVSYCPDNLLWKVWMGGARTELNYNNIEIARKLLKRALKEVPPKMKAMVLLECCRLEEYANQLDKAREILAKAKKYTKHEWKVFLESVLLEMRANNLDRAVEEAQQALLIHTGTGRLWAVMIQLKQSQGIEAQMKVFRTALSEVPKSGEVWCEGARIALQQNDFAAARKYINFAIQFTPQYGDSFIEYLRLEILENGNAANIQAVEQACVNADPNYGALWLHCKKNPLDSTRNVVREAIRLLNTPQSASDEVPAVSALMVNDIYQNVHQRSNEERRKAIFL